MRCRVTVLISITVYIMTSILTLFHEFACPPVLMFNGKRSWLAVLDGDSNPRLGLSSEFPHCGTTSRENNRNTGGDGEVEGCWMNSRWDGTMSAAYIHCKK